MQKRMGLVFLALFGSLIIQSQSVDAANYHEPRQAESIQQRLDNKPDDTPVIVADGGYYIGKSGYVSCDSKGENQIVHTPEDTTNPVTTVGQLKKIQSQNRQIEKMGFGQKNEYAELTPFGSAPADSNNTRVLKYGEDYESHTFSGSGWRFASMFFQPQIGTGAYLQWTSYVDAGVVGDAQKASYTYSSGLAHGRIVEDRQTVFETGYNNKTTYYTHSPLWGTQYVVANRD